MIERSLLDQRPCFFVTAGRRGGGKTTTLIMLIMAVTGQRPAAAAWSTNEEERRKALMSYFLYGVAYILWDNIAARLADHLPAHREVLHGSLLLPTASSASARWSAPQPRPSISSPATISSRRATSPRAACNPPRCRPRRSREPQFKHPDPIGWTENHRAEILAALYTILLGNPQLKQPRDAGGKTRFKMWWRLVGSAIEHAAKLAGKELDFQKLFVTQEEDDEEAASLADVLEILSRKWPNGFTANDVAGMINNQYPNDDEQLLRDYLLPGALPHHMFTAKSIGRRLKKHLDEPVKSGERTLVLRSWDDKHVKMRVYGVHVITTTTTSRLACSLRGFAGYVLAPL